MSFVLPPGWTGDGHAIRRTYLFDDFPQAMAFMVEVAFHCQSRDHHPFWANLYDRVEVELTTHDAGCVTDRDVRLAELMNEIYTAVGVQRPDGR